jgi:hypothetical protein
MYDLDDVHFMIIRYSCRPPANVSVWYTAQSRTVDQNRELISHVMNLLLPLACIYKQTQTGETRSEREFTVTRWGQQQTSPGKLAQGTTRLTNAWFESRLGHGLYWLNFKVE